jgi:hypothetical protein
MTSFEDKGKTFRFQLGGVIWQMCHKIIMVSSKDTIRWCVSANAQNNGVLWQIFPLLLLLLHYQINSTESYVSLIITQQI